MNPQHYIVLYLYQKPQDADTVDREGERGNIWSCAAITGFYKGPECSLNLKVPEAGTTHLIWLQPAYELEWQTQLNCRRYYGHRSCPVVGTVLML